MDSIKEQKLALEDEKDEKVVVSPYKKYSDAGLLEDNDDNESYKPINTFELKKKMDYELAEMLGKKESKKIIEKKEINYRVEDVLNKRINFIGFTIKDINSVHSNKYLKYDSRSFCQYFSDIMCLDHPFISLFTKKSLLEPFPLRLLLVVFSMSLIFTFNALFYSDYYISINAKKALNSEDVSNFLIFLDTILYSRWHS